MHKDYRCTRAALIPYGLQADSQIRFIQRLHDFAICADALKRFNHVAIKQLGQHDVAIKNLGAVLIRNT